MVAKVGNDRYLLRLIPTTTSANQPSNICTKSTQIQFRYTESTGTHMSYKSENEGKSINAFLLTNLKPQMKDLSTHLQNVNEEFVNMRKRE